MPFIYTVGIPISENEKDKYENVVEIDGKYFIVIGRTYATTLDVSKEDLLELRVAEVKVEKTKNDKLKITFDNPIVHSQKPAGTQTTTVKQLIALSKLRRGLTTIEFIEAKNDEEGGDTRGQTAAKNWNENWHKAYPESGGGQFILHHHYRGLLLAEINSKEFLVDATLQLNSDGILIGLDKESFELFKQADDINLLAFGDIPIDQCLKEPEILKKHKSVSVHGDLRFESTKTFLHGWTLFYSDDEVKKYEDPLLVLGKEIPAIQCHPKLFQPYAWVLVARKKPYVSEPGMIGATSKKYAKFFAFDWGTYKAGTWHRSFFEYILNGKKIKGRFIVQRAEIEGSRPWLIKKPESEKLYAQENDLEKVKEYLKKRGHKLLIWRQSLTDSPEVIKL